MAAAEARVPGPRWGRWTPARLVFAGAVLGAIPVLADAAVTANANLALLAGSLDATPYWLVLLNAALLGLLVPVGFFLVVCGILLALFASRPDRSRPFRAGLGGAGVSLAAGLLLGLLNLAWFLLPSELLTSTLLRNLVYASFAASVAAGLGTLVAFLAIADAVRDPSRSPSGLRALRVRQPPGKSIYEASPSSR